ncbi:MAG: Trm112 family protein [Phycisphaerae bacterium]
MTELDRELLAILRCPQTHAPLVQVGDWLYSTDAKTRRKYPIRDGIPVMLVEESVEVDEDEFAATMAHARCGQPGQASRHKCESS